MPFQWPLAMPPHCGPQIRSSCFDILSWFLSKVGSCYVLSKLEAYRLELCPCSYFCHCAGNLSVPDSFGRVVVLVSLTATSSVRPSLTYQHLTGLFELHVVVHVAIVCRMEYGGCSSFCSDRHPVQVVSGPNKCLVSLLRVGWCFEALAELFSGGPLSLIADSSGRPKLPGSDSRLNLVHLFAASCWCGLVEPRDCGASSCVCLAFHNFIEFVFFFLRFVLIH
ncbi:hypothetical protein IGI04_025452, partial [Brassica rapa subsp. trilocularis]